jgi:hypothetical protein
MVAGKCLRVVERARACSRGRLRSIMNLDRGRPRLRRQGSFRSELHRI